MSALLMSAGGKVMTTALAWPQKDNGRTYQPVRRGSVPEDEAKSFYQRERAGHTGREILRAAKRLMTDTFAGRKKGARRGGSHSGRVQHPEVYDLGVLGQAHRQAGPVIQPDPKGDGPCPSDHLQGAGPAGGIRVHRPAATIAAGPAGGWQAGSAADE